MERQRTTRQQRALDHLLSTSPEFRSAQDLHAQLSTAGAGVGLNTVYTYLRALVGRGAVDTIRAASGETLYRSCATSSHHHHLVCRVCGRTIEVAGAEVEEWAETVARVHGFVDVGHTLEIVGTCSICAR